MYDVKKSRVELEEQIKDLQEKLAELEREKPVLERAFCPGAADELLNKQDQEELLRKDRLAILGQLAAGIGHEVLNPLGVIKNSVYYLRMITSPDDPKATRHLDIIDREVERARKIVNDLLNLTRTAPHTREHADAGRLLDEAVHRAEVPADIEVMRSYQVGVPPVLCDPQQVVQVFINLLLNAVQALAKTAQPTIRLVVHTEEGVVLAAVEDNGPGLPSEGEDRIFDPLVSFKSEGFGLGLTVCRQLVSVNGGHIRAYNLAKGGAGFVVSFPVRETGESHG